MYWYVIKIIILFISDLCVVYLSCLCGLFKWCMWFVN